MILLDLEAYLSTHGRVSLAQMELKFGIDSPALRGMLAHLVRKGRIRRLPIPERCHGCLLCAQEALEFYEISGREPAGCSQC